jgi:hypothetical protein
VIEIGMALIPHSKTKQAVIVELVFCINEFLAGEIPDGLIPPKTVPKTLFSWLASCMKKAGKCDAQLANEQKHGGDNIENEDYNMLWITIYNRYLLRILLPRRQRS